MFTEPLPSSRLLLWLHYSGLQESRHNIVWDHLVNRSPVNVTVKMSCPSSTKQPLVRLSVQKMSLAAGHPYTASVNVYSDVRPWDLIEAHELRACAVIVKFVNTCRFVVQVENIAHVSVGHGLKPQLSLVCVWFLVCLATILQLNKVKGICGRMPVNDE